jgi:hypothetical protein
MMNKPNSQIEQQLNKMIDGTYLYMGRTLLISGWDSYNGFVIIFNDGPNIKFPLAEAPDELEAFMPAPDKVQQSAAVPAIIKKDMSRVNDLESTLMAQIDKIEEDPANIEAAKAIQAQAKTVLDIQKFKLDIVKEMRKQ